MPTRTLRLIATAAAGLLTVALAAGCASRTAEPGAEPSPSGGAGSAAAPELEAAWLMDGAVIGLVTWGSSSCPPQVEDVRVAADGSLSVALIEPADRPCTRDLAPRATIVALPAGEVDPTEDLDIVATLGDATHETALEGVDGLSGSAEMFDSAPSAGWTGADGMFVVVTYGSSTCVPVVASVEATGPAEVTMTFQDPPADQICTADLAPRGTVGVVEGLENDEHIELVLTGDGFDGVRVGIIGEN